ncbi:MAG: hypothetical protein HYW85_04935 [Deltaproteobacteria bacterium]|nr:hypothetical protein [Deltaproteobacteria bacterium]MBI3016910.1 hypothetical protein [Deltaproteobacteria bacterium]
MPFTNANQAIEHVFAHYEIPFLPQLPKQHLHEQMLYQFLEDFPGFTKAGNRLFIDLDTFKPQKLEHKSFLFSFLGALDQFIQKSKNAPLVKLQVTSPYTIASHLFCSDQKLVLDHPPIYEYLKEFIFYKTKALLQKFSQPKLLFFDEPMLSKSNVDEVLPMLEGMVRSLGDPRVRGDDNVCGDDNLRFGLHSCNLWSPVLFQKIFQSSFDIISFDMKEGGDTLLEEPEALFSFLKKGWLMWGVVPTSFSADLEPDFFIRFLKNKCLKKDQILTILSRLLMSPACGTSQVSVGQEQKCAKNLKQMALYSRKFYETKGAGV